MGCKKNRFRAVFSLVKHLAVGPIDIGSRAVILLMNVSARNFYTKLATNINDSRKNSTTNIGKCQ